MVSVEVQRELQAPMRIPMALAVVVERKLLVVAFTIRTMGLVLEALVSVVTGVQAYRLLAVAAVAADTMAVVVVYQQTPTMVLVDTLEAAVEAPLILGVSLTVPQLLLEPVVVPMRVSL